MMTSTTSRIYIAWAVLGLVALHLMICGAEKLSETVSNRGRSLEKDQFSSETQEHVLLSRKFDSHLIYSTNRTEEDLIFEYQFLQEECNTDAGSFENVGAKSSDLKQASSMVGLVDFLESFQCLNSNGILVNPGNTPGGVKTSVAHFDNLQEVFNSNFSFEMWVVVEEEFDIDLNYVLFELSRKVSTDELFTNGDYSKLPAWNDFDDFHFRLSISNGGVDLELRYVASDGTDLRMFLLSPTVSNVGLAVGDLYQLVVTVSDGFVTTYRNSNLVQQQVIGLPFQLPFEFPEAEIILGGTYGHEVGSLRNFPGTLHLAALYGRAFTEEDVSRLYEKALPNSPPFAHDLNLIKEEDIELSINLLAAVFDFDSAFGLQEPDFQEIITSLPTRGALSDDNGRISTLPHPVRGPLLYRQRVLHEDEGVDSFTFTLSDGEALSNQATADLIFIETNDIPVAVATFSAIPESRELSITLLGRDDLDFGKEGKRVDFAPKFITIQNVTNNFGEVKLRNEQGQCFNGSVVVPPFDIHGLMVDEENNFVAELCYAANESSILTEDAMIGTDFITFTVTDGANATSPPATSSISILSPLSAGCGGLGSEVCTVYVDEVGEEEAVDYEIVLSGIDHRCIENTMNRACEERQVEFMLTSPLPSPDVAVLIATSETNEDLIITKELVGDSGFVLPNATNKLRLRLQSQYFNLARHPLCLKQFSNKGADGFNLPCIGPDCEADLPFTTTNLNQEEITQCSELIDGGCPVLIHYRVQVGTGLSPTSSVAPLRVWVRNILTHVPAVVVTNPVYEGIPHGALTLLSASAPIQVHGADLDVKNLEVSLSIVGSIGETLLFISLDALDAVGNDIYSIKKDLCFFNGCNDTLAPNLIGTETKLNELLAGLTIFYTGEELSQPTELSLSVKVWTPFRVGSSQLQTYSETKIRLLIGETSDDDIDGSTGFGVFYAAISLAAVLVAMGVYTSIKRAAGCFLAVEKESLRLNRKLKKTKLVVPHRARAVRDQLLQTV